MEQPIPEMENENGADAPEITIDTEVVAENVQFGPGFAVSVSAKQDAHIERAGAMAINVGRDADISYGGATAINVGGSTDISFGGAMIINVGGNTEISNGGAFAINAAKNTELNNSVSLVMLSPKVHAQESTIGVLLSGSTELGEGTRVILNTKQAIALGAAAGAVFALLRWLMKR